MYYVSYEHIYIDKAMLSMNHYFLPFNVAASIDIITQDIAIEHSDLSAHCI